MGKIDFECNVTLGVANLSPVQLGRAISIPAAAILAEMLEWDEATAGQCRVTHFTFHGGNPAALNRRGIQLMLERFNVDAETVAEIERLLDKSELHAREIFSMEPLAPEGTW